MEIYINGVYEEKNWATNGFEISFRSVAVEIEMLRATTCVNICVKSDRIPNVLHLLHSVGQLDRNSSRLPRIKQGRERWID